MSGIKITISMKLILFSIVILLGMVPLYFMYTIVTRSVRQNIIENTTLLTKGILEQSHLYLNRLFSDLETRLDEISEDDSLLSGNGRGNLQYSDNNNLIMGSLAIYNSDPSGQSFFIDLEEEKIRPITDDERSSFFRSEPSALLSENRSRKLWSGKAPSGLGNSPSSMWLYRIVDRKNENYYVAASVGREEFLSLLSIFSETSEAEALLISSDNRVFPESINFFSYSFAAKALSRSIEGRFNIIYDSDGDDLMVQTYTDPQYFYNLVIITPHKTLFRGLDSVVGTMTTSLILLSVSSLGIGLVFIYLFDRQIRQTINAVQQIGSGVYELDYRRNPVELRENLVLRTAILKLADEVRDSRQSLEKRVKERTEELKTSLEELHITRQSLIHSEKMAAMGRQGAKIAHEINNPISVAVTASSHLGTSVRDIRKKFDGGKLTKTDFSEMLDLSSEISEIIQRNLRQASGMILGFKDFAADQARSEIRKIRIGNYVNEIIKNFSYKLRRTSYRIELNCDMTLEIVTIPSIIYQTITNLINNSLFHGFESRESGLMTIDISRDDEWIQIVYRDDGVGIENENLSQLFKPFFTTKAGEGGTGLGLNIIRDLIEGDLKGQITCESRPGEGVCFTVRFPRWEADA